MNEKLLAAKNFVVANKTKIFIATTVIATSAAFVMKVGLNQHNDFLRENGLYDKFYDLTKDAIDA